MSDELQSSCYRKDGSLKLPNDYVHPTPQELDDRLTEVSLRVYKEKGINVI